jgi:4-oxalocrotonate tautomerase
MPLINVKLIEGVFNEQQKKKMVTDITNAMVAIEGEPMRQVTWVVIEEVKSGNWAIGQLGDRRQAARNVRCQGAPGWQISRLGRPVQGKAARPAARHRRPASPRLAREHPGFG